MPAAADVCTYTFPKGGGLYLETVVDGDVICGSPRADYVRRMEGGIFRGGDGHDTVTGRIVDGVFRGGAGRDRVRRLAGGRFSGGAGNDLVARMHRGTFDGGADADHVAFLTGGAFSGMAGGDEVEYMSGGTFNGGPDGDGIGLDGFICGPRSCFEACSGVSSREATATTS